MLIQSFEPVIDRSWVPSSAWRSLHLLEQKKLTQRKTDFLDELPVMSGTVLGLEMLLHEPYIDLKMASELVLSDVGATIQILRLIGKEYDISSDRPYRMGDCLANLDVDDWVGAISARSFVCDREDAPIAAVWNHCRLVAQYSQLVAESLEHISPDDAYLVGLLHGVGAISAVMGWANSDSSTRGRGALFAMEGTMPLFVLAALRSVNDASPSPWSFILNTAHELADARAEMFASKVQDISSAGVGSQLRKCLPAHDENTACDSEEQHAKSCEEPGGATAQNSNCGPSSVWS